MNIKGAYRDQIIYMKSQKTIDKGWQSNTIVSDYGRYLAAIMKKDLPAAMGVEYIAVGKSQNNTETDFQNMIRGFFGKSSVKATLGRKGITDSWVYAKKIEPANITYVKGDGSVTEQPTNRIKIEVSFAEDEPADSVFEFKEFSLLGIYKEGGTFNLNTLYFINYVTHGVITKDNHMELNRTIKLMFPVDENRRMKNG